MSKKKTKLATVKKTIANAIDTTKKNVKNANSIALKSSEEFINESLTVATQWQHVSAKAIKGGFKLASNQQDIVFNALDTFKGQLVQGKKRFTKLFA